MNKIYVIFIMGFKAGIIGLPNIGKSTIFNGLYCVTYDPIAIPKKRELKNLYLIKALLFILSSADTEYV